MAEPVFVVASFSPQPDQQQAVEQILRGMAAASRREPGCVRYDFYRAENQSEPFVLIEAYRDPAALEAHRGTPHYQDYRARIGALLAQPVRVQVLHPIDVAGA